jgi:hypothetical protein
MTATENWRPISDPPDINDPVELVCLPAEGSAPTIKNYTIRRLCGVEDWNLDRAPLGWPATCWKRLGAPEGAI